MKGQIKEWNDAKGYGFISALNGEIKVFMHVSSITGSKGRPKLNDSVVFQVEEDSKGRLNAKKVRIQGASGVSLTVCFALGFLQVVAVGGLVVDGLPLFVASYCVLSLVSYAFFWRDKRAAQKGRWRTPESTLLLLSIVGGWPGALLAQCQFRHKSKKQPFKTLLWLCILLNISGLIWLFTDSGQRILQNISHYL
ncbi:DUF1294 domain-containing protein [Vibrio rarus]|uniref:DUF1294 domain-containing protein n=1 Tax=Vibrio rarus TaxID=413403 RepID=UPI0021C43B5A|nr:DUF1294 domain-containing protein [Vibrio rarus]